ncbi:hypothetical protein PCO85_18625 [Prodigiosinella aquatilis]|nr:hypothetical protein [Prodigiosinella sp. LS101]WJV53171.1 hypothetical protein PCO85_18625 [Prodigiosinella sp. LS101]WJV57530.1 hypothetical protein PCO84_18605 [Pectobacteriaceae bacterium C111]
MNQRDYITLRIINACLRENVSGSGCRALRWSYCATQLLHS